MTAPDRKPGESAAEPADADLLARARDDDDEAFAALVDRYRTALEGILVPLCRDREEARDLVQETILRASRNLDRYREGHKFSTWFFRIGVNLAISNRRRASVEQRILESAGRGDGPDLRLDRSVASPLDQLLRQEEGRRLADALRELPERYRDVLWQRYGEEMSCKAIAEAMGTTPNTISIILFRAKQRLRDALDEE